ncbi:STM4014 family protein [Lysobacter sp. CA199]|uniref:STM4014 family protein n=1 Tax=Lysobacter sp. CA199 TaxID=3455608 RepID=UPI003F8D0D47
MPADGWLLIGPRGSRRIRGLQQALHERGLPAAEELHYERVLEAPALAADAIARRPRALVKIESPGEAPALHTALIDRGWRSLGESGPRPRPLEHGQLAYQHYWYAGFRALLDALPREANYLNPPADIACMSDKWACQQRLQARDIAIPPLLGRIDGYAQLREHLREHACGQVFIKARYGSSGAGVLAYRCDRQGREALYGSAELTGDDGEDGSARIYNSLRPRRYTDPRQIARVIDAVAAQHAYLERWIAKPRAPDGHGHYDIRAVALDGRARHRLARIGRTPLTNLHLGNRRGALADWLDDDAMRALEDATERAAAAFPDSRMIGFDLILRDGRSWILEANAFGDLLLNLSWQGRSTYQDQVAQDRAASSACTLAELAHA